VHRHRPVKPVVLTIRRPVEPLRVIPSRTWAEWYEAQWRKRVQDYWGRKYRYYTTAEFEGRSWEKES
jgi:hypothetical protein